jgi:hypothetical protein
MGALAVVAENALARVQALRSNGEGKMITSTTASSKRSVVKAVNKRRGMTSVWSLMLTMRQYGNHRIPIGHVLVSPGHASAPVGPKTWSSVSAGLQTVQKILDRCNCSQEKLQGKQWSG